MMLRAIPGLKEVGKALLGIEHMQFTFDWVDFHDNMSFNFKPLFI